MRKEGNDIWLDEDDPEFIPFIEAVEAVLNDPDTEVFEF